MRRAIPSARNSFGAQFGFDTRFPPSTSDRSSTLARAATEPTLGRTSLSAAATEPVLASAHSSLPYPGYASGGGGGGGSPSLWSRLGGWFSGGDERRRDGGRTPSDLSDGGGGEEAVLTASTPFEVDAWAEAIRETKGALVGAAQQKQWRRVRDLAHAGRDANTRDGANQRTALHYVSGYGDTRTATALVTRGANVNARDRAGMTPLGWACLKGNVDVAQSLLKASADPLIKAHSGVLVGKTAVTLARLHGTQSPQSAERAKAMVHMLLLHCGAACFQVRQMLGQGGFGKVLQVTTR